MAGNSGNLLATMLSKSKLLRLDRTIAVLVILSHRQATGSKLLRLDRTIAVLVVLPHRQATGSNTVKIVHN